MQATQGAVKRATATEEGACSSFCYDANDTVHRVHVTFQHVFDEPMKRKSLNCSVISLNETPMIQSIVTSVKHLMTHCFRTFKRDSIFHII